MRVVNAKSFWKREKFMKGAETALHSQTAAYLHPSIQLLLILCEALDGVNESNGNTVTVEVTRPNIGRYPECTG